MPSESSSVASIENGADETGSMQKCPNPVRLYHAETGRRLILPCRRRVCGWCGPRHWRPKVLARLHSGLGGSQFDYLAILLTAPGENDGKVRAAGFDYLPAHEFNAEASKRWHHFCTLLRRAYPGADLQFWRVAELQVRGHVHFHFVLRGLRFLPVGKVRALALQAGFGSWVGVRRPRDYPGGVRSVGSYFGKYLLKTYASRSGVTKLVTFSQGWCVAWEDRRRSARSSWLFAGGIHSGWRVIGTELAPARRGDYYGPSRDDYVPSWHVRSWQRARAGEERPIGWVN